MFTFTDVGAVVDSSLAGDSSPNADIARAGNAVSSLVERLLYTDNGMIFSHYSYLV